MEIKLSSGAKVDGVTVDRLTMREPTVDDMMTVKKSHKTPEDQELALFSNLCEVTPETLRALSFKDYRRMQKAFSELTEDDESPLD